MVLSVLKFLLSVLLQGTECIYFRVLSILLHGTERTGFVIERITSEY